MRFLLISIFPFLVLCGCGTVGVRTDTPAAVDTYAKTLVEQGKFALAADEYLRLAELYPDNSDSYKLDAAHAYLQHNAYNEAASILINLVLKRDRQTLLFSRSVLLARIALSQNRSEDALSLLSIDIPENAPLKYIRDLFETRAKALAMQNNYLDAAREQMNRGNYLLDAGETDLNIRLVWQYVMGIDTAKSEELLRSRGNGIRSWIELAVISKHYLSDKDRLKAAIELWADTYPQHPANPIITDQILATSDSVTLRPKQIALLLPLTGPFEQYSIAIRDGFLAAWFTETGYKPGIKIYNTDSLSFTDVYQKAVDDGADFIVGPLEKNAVRMLDEMAEIPVKTLALNQIDKAGISAGHAHTSLIPDLIQFGLTPEDEARQVAWRGLPEGFNRALVISSADNYGDRVVNAFSEEWTKSGGRILERVYYDPQTREFATPVKRLLNIDSSEARINTLRQRLSRSLTGTSRIREDAQFIFMVASSNVARQIVPQLRFYRADQIPVYTISYVYSGKINARVDSDLNGVEFVDIPWLLKPGAEKSELNIHINNTWPVTSTNFPRYFAFGVDAYRMIPHLADMSINEAYKYPGESGELYITNTGIIRRNLLWARFVNGEPRLIKTGVLD